MSENELKSKLERYAHLTNELKDQTTELAGQQKIIKETKTEMAFLEQYFADPDSLVQLEIPWGDG